MMQDLISRKEVIATIKRFVDSFDLDDWSQEQLGALVHDVEQIDTRMGGRMTKTEAIFGGEKHE